MDTTRIDPGGPASDDLSFRADAVMPAQFYPDRPGSASVEPIMRLMAGILIDAVRCFQNNFEARHPSRRQEFREARLWIFDDRGTGPFSFRSVCDSLEVDPPGLRNWIVRWQEKGRSGERQRMIRRSGQDCQADTIASADTITGKRSERCIPDSENNTMREDRTVC